MRYLDEQETTATLRDYHLDRPRGPGFAFYDRARHTFYDWHTHDYHQLIYAIDGTTQIETECARYLLPTGRAAWIPIATRHRTLITDVECASLYFAPRTVPDPQQRVRILAASPLMREMILHALRWPLGASEADPVAASFFRTLGLMCSQWLESELLLSLPSARHPAIKRAMDRVASDPGRASLARALALASMSERTFRRTFTRETGMTWQAWLGQARIMEAACQLAHGGRITDVAAEVGYSSMSAFAKAFKQLTGASPATFRRRAGVTSVRSPAQRQAARAPKAHPTSAAGKNHAF
jgi:AraC-like DNA-binding protein